MNLNHRGVEYVVVPSATPGFWQWQFRIGDRVKTGRTETRIGLLAMRRVQLRIDRELKDAARDQASTALNASPDRDRIPGMGIARR